jgi:tRNA pseudouridine55 synthase
MGHSGTLDPLATGGLLVAVGNSTRLLPLLNHDHKTYRFTACFDGITASLDLDTPIELFDRDEVQRVGNLWNFATINQLLQTHVL